MWTEVLGGECHQIFIDAGGIRTRVLEAGTGAPLLLLHGMGGHAEAYVRNLKGLSRRFRVIAYDMLGHGFSDKPDYPYTIDRYVAHLGHVMDALGIPDAHLSGESLGGWVTAWFAQQHPGRVRKILLNTPGNITNKPDVMQRIKDITLQAVDRASPETVRQRLEWLFHKDHRALVTDDLIHTRYLIYTQPGFTQAIRNVLVLQEAEVRQRFAWAEAWCSRIRCPSVILWTSDDPTGTMEEARLLVRWIPGARLHVIDHAGHWPQWESPKEFNDLCIRFFLGADA
jgi:2-hydroxy-6-oxonona-2,4-dienedioate hydrolase